MMNLFRTIVYSYMEKTTNEYVSVLCDRVDDLIHYGPAIKDTLYYQLRENHINYLWFKIKFCNALMGDRRGN
jgi:hypothetical protein